MDDIETITQSDESAFHALGFNDADDLFVRADLQCRVVAIVRAMGEDQARSRMRIDGAEYKTLIRDEFGVFGTERLLMLLRDLGHDIELRIKPAAAGAGRFHVCA